MDYLALVLLIIFIFIPSLLWIRADNRRIDRLNEAKNAGQPIRK